MRWKWTKISAGRSLSLARAQVMEGWALLQPGQRSAAPAAAHGLRAGWRTERRVEVEAAGQAPGAVAWVQC
jgi:hypothetical protein